MTNCVHRPQDWSPSSRSADIVGRLDIPALLLMLIGTSWGCTTSIASGRPSTELSGRSGESAALGDLIGVGRGGSLCLWSRIGTSRGGSVNIGLTLVPATRSKVTGFYTCASDTVGCRNRLQNGEIVNIEMNGKRLWLRVMLADGSSCLFTSRS